MRPPLRLLLAGGGHAHLGVLADWIRKSPEGIETRMVTPAVTTVYSGMTPGWIAGCYDASQFTIDLLPLARRAGVELVIGEVCGVDPERNLVTLADGRTLSFDVLSLAIGGEVDTSHFAMLGDRLLPIRPMDKFVANWPQVMAQARQRAQFRLIVVGGGPAGVELALAAHQAFRRETIAATIVLVTDETGLVATLSATARAKLGAKLAIADIAVRIGHAVGTSDGIELADGSRLAADCVIAATGSKPPYWLKDAGLQCDSHGYVAIGADLRSVSHHHVFAAGDIAARVDRPVARSGVHAVRSSPVLAATLRAAATGQALRRYIPRRNTLYLLATGDRCAILSWGALTLSGRAMWRLKDWIDRRFIARYARLGATTPASNSPADGNSS